MHIPKNIFIIFLCVTGQSLIHCAAASKKSNVSQKESTDAARKQSVSSNLMVQPEELIAFIQQSKQAPQAQSKPGIIQKFMQEVSRLKTEYGAALALPPKEKNSLRIATWNVHGWKNPLGQPNFNEMYATIQELDADVIVLQEVVFAPNTKDVFKKIGYENASFAGGPSKASAFGNMILSKLPFATMPEKDNFSAQGKDHKRSYIRTEIDLKQYGKQNLVIYGTHLEVIDANQRFQEVKQLTELTARPKDQGKNVVIAADWNTSQNGPALNYLEQAGFKDSFSVAKLEKPYFTHWTGKSLDFLYVRENGWNLPMNGGYLIYTAASDHMPVVMDIDLSSNVAATVNTKNTASAPANCATAAVKK